MAPVLIPVISFVMSLSNTAVTTAVVHSAGGLIGTGTAGYVAGTYISAGAATAVVTGAAVTAASGAAVAAEILTGDDAVPAQEIEPDGPDCAE